MLGRRACAALLRVCAAASLRFPSTSFQSHVNKGPMFFASLWPHYGTTAARELESRRKQPPYRSLIGLYYGVLWGGTVQKDEMEPSDWPVLSVGR